MYQFMSNERQIIIDRTQDVVCNIHNPGSSTKPTKAGDLLSVYISWLTWRFVRHPTQFTFSHAHKIHSYERKNEVSFHH